MDNKDRKNVTVPEESETQGPARSAGIVPTPAVSSSYDGLPVVLQEGITGELTTSQVSEDVGRKSLADVDLWKGQGEYCALSEGVNRED